MKTVLTRSDLPMSADTVFHALKFLNLTDVIRLSMTSTPIRHWCMSLPFCQAINSRHPYWFENGYQEHIERLRSVISLLQNTLQSLDLYLSEVGTEFIANTAQLRVLRLQGCLCKLKLRGLPCLEHLDLKGDDKVTLNIRDYPRLQSSSGITWEGMDTAFQHPTMRLWDARIRSPESTHPEEDQPILKLSDLLSFPRLTTLKCAGEVVVDCDTKNLPALTEVHARGQFFDRVLECKSQAFIHRLTTLGLYSPLSSRALEQLTTERIHTIHLNFPPSEELVRCTPGVKKASVKYVADLATVALWPRLHSLDVMFLEVQHIVVLPKLTALRCLRIDSPYLESLVRHPKANTCLEYLSLPSSKRLDFPRIVSDFPALSYLCIKQNYFELVDKTAFPNLQGLRVVHDENDELYGTEGITENHRKVLDLQELVLYCVNAYCEYCRVHPRFTTEKDEFFSDTFHKHDPYNFYHTHFQHHPIGQKRF